jgi:paraquat-inducible protein B
MSKKANPTLIGVFVLGAAALVVIGLLTWSSGLFAPKRDTYVLYFAGSVKGLDIGAPVLIRGVRVGSVTDIQVQIEPDPAQLFSVPVFIQIEPERFTFVAITREELQENILKEGHEFDTIEPLIEAGLRGQLTLQSVVTGRLAVQLEYFPDRPAVFRGSGMSANIEEIPTIATPLQAIQETLAEVDFKAMADKITSAVDAAERLLNSPELASSIKSLDKTLKSADTLAQQLTKESVTVSHNLETTLQQGDKTLVAAEQMFDQGTLTLRDARAAIEKVEETLANADQALNNVTLVLGDDSAVLYQLTEALEEMRAAAQSMRELANSVERRPESLLRGRQ